jgi:ATP-dependent protease ClpP protease subunit
MDNEIFISSSEAVEYGLATEIGNGEETTSKIEINGVPLLLQNEFSRLFNRANPKDGVTVTRQDETKSPENKDEIAALTKNIAEKTRESVASHLKYYDVCKDKVLQNIKEGVEFTAEVAEFYAEAKIAQIQNGNAKGENQNLPLTKNSDGDEKTSYRAIKDKLVQNKFLRKE